MEVNKAALIAQTLVILFIKLYAWTQSYPTLGQLHNSSGQKIT